MSIFFLGTSSGIKLHIDEIFDIVASALLNQSWKLKAQAAKSIETIADSLGRLFIVIQYAEFV